MVEAMEAPTSHLVILTTVGDRQAGLRIARELVSRRLAGCVNVVGPMRSFYRWKGEVQEEAEYMLVIKTTRENFERIALALKPLHPYELPELIAFSIEAGDETYLNWLTASSSETPGDLP